MFKYKKEKKRNLHHVHIFSNTTIRKLEPNENQNLLVCIPSISIPMQYLFLEHAGDLHIISLRRKIKVQRAGQRRLLP
jgi:hypothetical protein